MFYQELLRKLTYTFYRRIISQERKLWETVFIDWIKKTCKSISDSQIVKSFLAVRYCSYVGKIARNNNKTLEVSVVCYIKRKLARENTNKVENIGISGSESQMSSIVRERPCLGERFDGVYYIIIIRRRSTVICIGL